MIYRRLIALLVLTALASSSVLAGTTTNSGSANSPVNQPSAGQAFTLTSLRHESVGAVTRILVESTAPPLYTVLRPTDRLIIVDLPGGEGSKLSSEYAVKSAVVDSITVRRARDDDREPPRAMTRLEIAVRGEVRDRSVVSGSTLMIELSPLQGGFTPVSQLISQPKESKSDADPMIARAGSKSNTSGSTGADATKKAADKTGVYVNPRAVSAGKTAGSPASLVSAVRANSSSGNTNVVIEADGVPQYKDFTLADPWRIILDVAVPRSSVGNKVIQIGAGQVDRVRVSQFSSNVLRVVVDTKQQVPYHVVRDNSSLIVVVGEKEGAPATGSTSNDVRSGGALTPQPAGASQSTNQLVKAAATGQTEEKAQSKAPGVELIAGATQGSQGRPAQPRPAPAQSATQPGTSSPKTTAPATQPQTQPRAAAGGNTSGPTSAAARSTTQRRPELAFCDPDYVGGPISFDLRAGVDIRDMLRFISQQYGINFIVDKSVGQVGVDIRVTEIPWNQAIGSVLRANRLGAVCESDGKIIRIATLQAIKEEREQTLAVEEARKNAGPLVTKIKHLRYARALGSLAATGNGASGRGGLASGGGGGGMSGGGGSSTGGGRGGTGTLLKIIESRLSKRGKIEVDGRTNSLIITDVPESFEAIDEMIALLDKPEPQVEIEARIVIANRGFLRDLGNELGAAAVNSHQGATGFFQTSPLQINNGALVPGGSQGSGGGSSGGSGNSNSPGTNLAGQVATGALRAAAPSSVLALTTGLLGTSIISMTISAHERKGQIRTIATPRITAQDNQTAEIVNGVQIPIQTVSNNTITTTFVTAALRLEITPQIVEDTGEVMIHVIAENNSVNTAIAQALGSGIPGIDTQSAESTVRVSDGGTTVMGGITVDREAYSTVRTPGISRVPILGNVFKRKTTEKNSDEILFFITPRIVRPDGSMAPANLAPQRSSAQPAAGNPTDPQRAAASSATPAPPVTAGAGVGQAKK